MTTLHVPVHWTAGDDWQINATLLHQDGSPYDLNGPHTIKWALIGLESGQRMLDETDAIISTVDAVAGKCSIKVAASLTSPLYGRYVDIIRIVYAGITSTLAYGQINVFGDPWRGAHSLLTGRASLKLIGNETSSLNLIASG